MELLKNREALAKVKIVILLAGLGAPRIIVVSGSIEELQHYAVTHSAFWEMGSRRWRGGKFTGYTGGDEMDLKVWSVTIIGEQEYTFWIPRSIFLSDLYKRCLNEIIDETYLEVAPRNRGRLHFQVSIPV